MKLTIITVNYNNATDLANTINSVLAQKWTAFEYIIIDGGSKDESLKIIEAHKQKLAYWVSEPDRGVFHAMNKGLSKATGEYILMLNSGDLLYNEETLGQIFADNFYSEDILTGDVYRSIEGKIFDKSYFPDNINFNFFRNGSLSHQSSFIKKELHELIGAYDESLIYAADWKFFILALCKYNVSYKHLPFFVAICDCGGLTSDAKNFNAMKRESKIVLDTHFPAFTSDYRELDTFRNQIFKKRLSNIWPNTKLLIKKLLVKA